uniref:Uncharacterized protein n=1 Tax=Rhizophora mucronata TaxID=61149 RepID=A0A2P2NHX2_RHIMU
MPIVKKRLYALKCNTVFSKDFIIGCQVIIESS